jgi:FkbM family methyltransferase
MDGHRNLGIKHYILHFGYLVGRVLTYKHDGFRHVFRESWSELAHNTCYIDYGHYNLFKTMSETILKDKNFKVLDVGAFDGWFAKAIMRFCPGATVISYEPSASQINNLNRCAAMLKGFSYHSCALSDRGGEVILHEYEAGFLNSLNQMLTGAYLHRKAKPAGQYLVPITTLDQEAERLSLFDKNILLKIDVQGHELSVLRGASKLLEQANVFCIIVELVNKRKYYGQALAAEIICFLHNRGYEIYDLCPVYREQCGWTTEFDSVFIRNIP